MRRQWILNGILGSLAFVGCTPADQTPDDYAGYLPLTGSVILRSDSLHEIRDIHLTKDGTVLVVNGIEPFLMRLSPSGKLTAEAFPGPGPLEVRFPVALVSATSEDEPMLVDLGKRRVTPIPFVDDATARSIPVRYARVSTSLLRTAFGRVFPFAMSGGLIIAAEYPGGLGNQAGFWMSRIVGFSPGGGSATEITRFDSIGRSPEVNEKIGFSKVFTPIPLWSVCPDSTVASYIPFRSEIRFFDLAGTLLESFSTRDRYGEITNADRLAFVEFSLGGGGGVPEEIKTQALSLVRQARGEFSHWAPAFVNILCGRGREVWLQEFSSRDHPVGLGRGWRIVSSGKTVQRVVMPPGFQPLELVEGGAIGVITDNVGVESVMIVAVPGSGSHS